METEHDAPHELLEVGPRVHLAQWSVKNCWKNTSKGTYHRPAHQGSFFLSSLATNTQSVTFTGGKNSLIGHWLDNIKAGSQTGKPLTDLLLSEIRCLDTKFEPIQIFPGASSGSQIQSSRAQSSCSRWEAGMAEQSRHSQLPAATQTVICSTGFDR